MRFARSQETQADSYAFSTLEKANIHPKYFGTIMSKLNSLSEDNELIDILNTHPNSKQRMKKAFKFKLKDSFKEKKLNIDLEKFQDVLN